MRTFEYAIIDDPGIHARLAGMLVKETGEDNAAVFQV